MNLSNVDLYNIIYTSGTRIAIDRFQDREPQ